MKVLALFTLLVVTSFCSNAKEFTQQESDRFNFLFEEANRLITPFVRIQNIQHSKANISALNKAISYYDEALEINPDSWQTLFLRGKAFQALSNAEAAYASFKRAYEIMPHNPDVTNEYVLESLSLNKIEEALTINKTGASKFPNHLGLQANFSMVLLLTGNVGDAITQGNIALKLAPNDKVTQNLIDVARAVQAGTRTQPKTIYELTAGM